MDSDSLRHPSQGYSSAVDDKGTVRSGISRDRPSFTFVEQSDNRQFKRIHDVTARKAIRSHVMRDVRRRERIAGLKRPSKKGEKQDDGDGSKNGICKRASAERTLSNEQLPERIGSPFEKKSPRNSSVSESEISPADTKPRSELTPIGRDSVASPSAVSLDLLDPFSTLPGDPPKEVGQLLHHCANILIPMTFPLESTHPEEMRKRVDTIVRSALSHGAIFYAYMTFSSGHRSLLTGEHTDIEISGKSMDRQITSPDYFAMKATAISMLNDMMKNPEQATSNLAFEAVMALISTCTTVGQFNECRTHLKGLLKMAQFRGGVSPETFASQPRLLMNILSCDSFACSAILARPVFPIPWVIEPIHPSILAHIAPSPDSRLARLATLFPQISVLSPRLVQLLLNLRDLAYLDDWNSRDAHGLSASEFEVFRTKSHETQYQLLSYPFESADTHKGRKLSQLFHPLDLLTRTAAILYMCNVITLCPPTTGLARSVTFRFKRQYQSLQWEKPPSSTALDLTVFCMFLGVQSSLGQVEEPWFVKKIAELAKLRGWKEWEEVESVMETTLYVRRVSGNIWSGIWQSVRRVMEEDSTEGSDRIIENIQRS